MKTKQKQHVKFGLYLAILSLLSINCIANITPDSDSLPDGIKNATIGKPELESKTVYIAAEDKYIVGGGGFDVWGKADECNFVYIESEENTEIEIRLADMDTEHATWNSKAFIMVRDNLNPGSSMAYVDVLKNGVITFLGRTRENDNTQTFAQIKNVDPVIPRWLKLVRQGRFISTYHKPDTNGADWELIGTALLEINNEAYLGFGVCGAGGGEKYITCEFDSFKANSAGPRPSDPLPAGIKNTDIGNPDTVSTTSYYSYEKRYILGGGGTDIWGTTDECNFVYQASKGNKEMIVRLVKADLENALWNSKGFIMVRSGLEPGSAMAFIEARNDGKIFISGRPDDDENAQIYGQIDFSDTIYPRWFKLTRNEDSITAYHKPDVDKADWEIIGTANISIKDTAYLGFGVCGAGNGKGYITCTFDQLQYKDIETKPDEVTAIKKTATQNGNLSISPNPVSDNGSMINFNLKKPGFVNISVYDNQGKLCMVLLNEDFAIGKHQINFNPLNLNNEGMYIIILSTPYSTETNRFIYIK